MSTGAGAGTGAEAKSNVEEACSVDQIIEPLDKLKIKKEDTTEKNAKPVPDPSGFAGIVKDEEGSSEEDAQFVEEEISDAAVDDVVKKVPFPCDYVGVIWEVTFNHEENVLSSIATRRAFAHERNPPRNARFLQSIRDGLKEIFISLGLAEANSRSSHIGPLKIFNEILNGKDLATFLANIPVAPPVAGVNKRRASRWLKAVLLQQHELPVAQDPKNRKWTTPLLFISCNRLL